jgi:release factor glutamine methyltransferase
VAEAIRDAASRLASSGIETPRLDAEVLLRHVLQVDRTALFLRLREELSAPALAAFEQLVERRLTFEPVAYIVGVREFMGLDFSVGPEVLIPRPETELLVEWATERLRTRPRQVVVDVGTGSGAIILALAIQIGQRSGDLLVGSDLSASALRYAARNRSCFGLEESISLVRGDLLTWAQTPIDLVLANLPYLRPDQVAANREIHAEPEAALIAGADGLEAISRLVDDLARVLARGGAVILEIDPSQSIRVAALLSTALPAADVHVRRDLAGLDRFVVGELKS